LSAPLAIAQEATITVGEPELRGSFDSDPRALSPAEEAALRQALSVDVKTLNLRSRPFDPGKDNSRLDWSRTERGNGASTVTVKRVLPTEWDSKIGADIAPAPAAPNLVQTDRLLTGPSTDRGSGAAWASIAVPNVAALDARVNPAQDQGALGATFKQSLPVGSDYAVTLQNRYGMVDTFGGNVAGAAPSRVYTTEREIKLDILDTRTAVSAGTSSNTADNATRGRVGAEQKIYGPLAVSAGVSDIGAPVTNKSVKAGLRLDW
jgi:hypothetical protein